jgi:hypothetical protein
VLGPGRRHVMIDDAAGGPTDDDARNHRNQTQCTELEDYLVTFVLTRGIHKRMDVSEDALT